jgi:hypothetical protein
MKTKPILFGRARLSVVMALSVIAAMGPAVGLAAPAPAGAKSATPTNTAPVIVITKSVFESSIKDNPALKDYKDPFFPNSVRVHPPPAPPPRPVETTETKKPVVVVVPKKRTFLTLSGLTRRIALISSQGKTFEFGVGESDVIPTPGGDARVKCLEIKKNSVLVQMDDEKEPVELKLASDLQ